MLGLSGGLDSTLALLVCARTLDLLGRARPGVLAVTMPGFGTTARTLESAHGLAAAWRAELREIDIRPACAQHIRDIGLDPADRESVTFQNLQARERTQVLMDLANKEGGLVVGTGDLSELALGFATFAGDQIAMYNVNASVPKTLVRHLVGWVAAHGASERERATLQAVLDTPVSPELVPPGKDGETGQRTEDLIGPYELHDFFLYCLLRFGRGSRQDPVPGEPRLRLGLSAGRAPALAARVPRALLRAAVQALGDARRPEGRVGEPVPAGRLAHAERRRGGRLAA